MGYSIKVNRTTAHIAGFATKCNGPKVDRSAQTGVVGYYAENACGSITRGNLATTGAEHATAADALKAARLTRSKVCKNCERAALAQIALDEQAAAEAAATVADEQAPAVTAIVLPQGVTMNETTRVLSGPIRNMRALMDSGLAVLTDDGDLVLI